MSKSEVGTAEYCLETPQVDVVCHYRLIVATQAEARLVSHRFRSELEGVLTESGLSSALTEPMREDGLREAPEDVGSFEEDADVSF